MAPNLAPTVPALADGTAALVPCITSSVRLFSLPGSCTKTRARPNPNRRSASSTNSQDGMVHAGADREAPHKVPRLILLDGPACYKTARVSL